MMNEKQHQRTITTASQAYYLDGLTRVHLNKCTQTNSMDRLGNIKPKPYGCATRRLDIAPADGYTRRAISEQTSYP